MKQTSLKKRILAVCLLIITSIFIVSCKAPEDPAVKGDPIYTADTALGTGENTFNFKVINYEGREINFVISTDKTIVGEALTEVGLIEGEKGPYGTYVKRVNGIRADYNVDGKYWAFHIDGLTAPDSVDKTEITPGAQYAFVVE